jgi:hypothetical protein
MPLIINGHLELVSSFLEEEATHGFAVALGGGKGNKGNGSKK